MRGAQTHTYTDWWGGICNGAGRPATDRGTKSALFFVLITHIHQHTPIRREFRLYVSLWLSVCLCVDFFVAQFARACRRRRRRCWLWLSSECYADFLFLHSKFRQANECIPVDNNNTHHNRNISLFSNEYQSVSRAHTNRHIEMCGDSAKALNTLYFGIETTKNFHKKGICSGDNRLETTQRESGLANIHFLWTRAPTTIISFAAAAAVVAATAIFFLNSNNDSGVKFYAWFFLGLCFFFAS